MSENNQRIECQLHDIREVANLVAEAKRNLKYGTPAWNALDMAEAKLMGLGMFTALGRDESNRSRPV